MIKRQLFKGGVLSLISGVALWLPFHHSQFFFLAWVGLVPFLFLLISKPTWKLTLLAHALMSTAYLGGSLYWVPRVLVVYGNLGWLVALGAFGVMLTVLGLVLLPFTLLTRWTAGKSVGLALGCVPGFWLLTELCRNFFPLNGFPWALLGYSQSPYLWIIQSADISGVYLVSMLLVGANTAFVAALRFKTFKPLVAFAIPFLMANLYGAYRVNWWEPEAGPALRGGYGTAQHWVVQGSGTLCREILRSLARVLPACRRGRGRVGDLSGSPESVLVSGRLLFPNVLGAAGGEPGGLSAFQYHLAGNRSVPTLFQQRSPAWSYRSGSVSVP